MKDLIHFLRDGQRLQMPVFSPDFIGGLMNRCWAKEPGDRPTFSELERELGNMLEEEVKQYFLKMNDFPYLNMRLL